MVLLTLIMGLATPYLADGRTEKYRVTLESGETFELLTYSNSEHFYLEAAPFLEALGWYSKPLSETSVGLCTRDICVPLNTDVSSQAVIKDGRLFLNMDFAGEPMNFAYRRDDESKAVALRLLDEEGRASTQIVFPSLDLEMADGSGKTLNTTEYLQGKRAIVFCFASW
jgi:hypothetical protein